MRLHLWRIDPLVPVSFSALSCTRFRSWGISSLSVSIPKSESVIQSSTVYVLTFAFIVPVCPPVGFVSWAMSSEARRGGWDERFIQRHGVWEEAEGELIRISLPRQSLCSWHFISLFSEQISPRLSQAEIQRKCLTLVGCWCIAGFSPHQSAAHDNVQHETVE